MADNRVFVGREAELKQFKEVLHDTKGQAVLVVGQAGMGKTWLMKEMLEGAYGELELECGWVSYEVTANDRPDSIMGLMMDNAFGAASTKPGNCDDVSERKRQWLALFETFIPRGEQLAGLAKSLRWDPAKDKREQFLERLALISRRMPVNGRAIFTVDPEKYMCRDSDQDWAIVVKNLPEKVKFVFAQRPEDVLVGSETFGALGNVVRIPDERLGKLDDEAVGRLVSLRGGGRRGAGKKLLKALRRYDGYPYALGAALNLIEAGVPIDELPKRAEPTEFARVQWDKLVGKGEKAIRLFKAYAILEVCVADGVVESVSEVGSDTREHLLADKYLVGLLREEVNGRRIYHSILADHVLSQMREEEKKQYHRRAGEAYRAKPVVVNPTRREEIEPLLKAAEHLLAAGDPDAATDILLTKPSQESYYTPSEWLWKFGYLDEDIRIIGDAIRVYENVIEKGGRVELRGDLAGCFNNRGLALGNQGKLGEAIEDCGRAIGIYERLVEKEGRRELRNDLASCYNNRGIALRGQGKLDEAVEDYGRAIRIREGLVEKEGRVELRGDLARCYKNRSNVLRVQGKLDEAIEDCKRTNEIYEEVVEKEGRLELRNELAGCYNNYALVLKGQGELGKAIENYGRAIGIYEGLVEKEVRIELRNELAGCYSNRGNALGDLGNSDEAIEDYGRAIGIREGLIAKEGRLELRWDLFSSLFNRSMTRGQKKEWKGAQEDMQRGGTLLRGLVGEGQRHLIESFMQTADYRCSFAKELGGAKEAAAWANDAMRWFVEEAEAGEMNEVLSRQGREFAGTVLGKHEELIKGGLDEGVLGRFLEVLKEAGG